MRFEQDVTAPVPIERPKEKAVGVLQVGVLYPIFVAGLSGFLMAVLVLLAVWLIDEALAGWSLSKKTYLIIFLVTFSLVTTLVWKDFVERGWWAIEEMVRRDLNQDGVIGKPPQQISRHEIVIPQENRAVYLDLPISNQEMARIATALLSNQVNVSVNGLKAYTPHAAALVAQLEARGMAVRKSPLQPGELTVWGKHWLKSVVAESGS